MWIVATWIAIAVIAWIATLNSIGRSARLVSPQSLFFNFDADKLLSALNWSGLEMCADHKIVSGGVLGVVYRVLVAVS